MAFLLLFAAISLFSLRHTVESYKDSFNVTLPPESSDTKELFTSLFEFESNATTLDSIVADLTGSIVEFGKKNNLDYSASIQVFDYARARLHGQQIEGEGQLIESMTFATALRQIGSADLISLEFALKDMHKMVKAATKGDSLEGFMAVQSRQVRLYLEVGNTHWVRNICEVGFNGGHSAFSLLFGSKSSKLISFDFLDKSFQPLAMRLIKSIFGDSRASFVAGDSTRSIPAYSHSQSNTQCEVFSIDGGHSFEVASQDIRNFEPFSGCDNIVLMDDVFQNYADAWNAHHVDGAKRAWIAAIEAGTIRQYGCYEYLSEVHPVFVDIGVLDGATILPRSFCIGHYNNINGCGPDSHLRSEARILDILTSMGLTACEKGGCN
jgi:hypothetical protein